MKNSWGKPIDLRRERFNLQTIIDRSKWILLHGPEYKRIQLIWEKEDHSSTQYPKILDHAVAEGWLDKWFVRSIWFKSAKEAKAKGYRPCKVCNPPSAMLPYPFINYKIERIEEVPLLNIGLKIMSDFNLILKKIGFWMMTINPLFW